MIIKLRTRCGCTREIETTYPPSPEIILPLQEQLRVTAGIDSKELYRQSIETRRFKLRDFINAGPNYSTATYVETK